MARLRSNLRQVTQHGRVVLTITLMLGLGATASIAIAGNTTGNIAVAKPSKKVRVAPKPSQAELKGFVQQQFGKIDGYKNGDLVTRSGVQKVLVALSKKGWKVKDEKALLDRVLPDDDFLIKQFSDQKGRSFLRQIQDLPGGIDRVDRLARMPQGQADVNNMIRKLPNGVDIIKAMTTTDRGRRLGERLSKAPTGHHFNDKTGHIYQAGDLAAAMYPELTPASLPNALKTSK